MSHWYSLNINIINRQPEKATYLLITLLQIMESKLREGIDSIGTEALEALGFDNEKSLEEALVPLMQELEQEYLMAA